MQMGSFAFVLFEYFSFGMESVIYWWKPAETIEEKKRERKETRRGFELTLPGFDPHSAENE